MKAGGASHGDQVRKHCSSVNFTSRSLTWIPGLNSSDDGLKAVS